MFDFPTNVSDGHTLVHPNGKTYSYSDGSWTIVQSHDHDHDLITSLTARIAVLEAQLAEPYLLLE